VAVFDDLLKMKLETLLGERGTGKDAALRRRDLDAALGKASGAKAQKSAQTIAEEAAAIARRAERAVQSLSASIAENGGGSGETAQNERLLDAVSDLFQWNGNSYTLRVPAVDVIGELTADYSLVIESSLGTIFRVGEGRTTTFSARVFRNGEEVTDEIPASWFRWRRVTMVPQPYPNDDATWNSQFQGGGYRSISITVDAVFGRATFFCDLQPPE
jgi:hypothetical protein